MSKVAEPFGLRITGTGSYVPERVLTNDDLAEMVDTSDEWIQSRTGIRERRIAADDQPTSALAAAAAQRALEAAGRTAEEIDLIIVGTITPDKPFPNTACFVQKQIGAVNAVCFSLEAACSGFVYILDVASAMLATGRFKRALLIGAEKLSSIVNWEDRATCVLFGDGAGAVVAEACEPDDDCFLASHLGADGRSTDILHVPAGGTAEPLTEDNLDSGRQYLTMNGAEVFKQAVTMMAAAAQQTVEESGIDVDKIRWLIPHQANTRIINSVAKRLELPEERIFINLDKYGNTSAASIPIALDEVVRTGQLDRGDYVLLMAFGGGLTWGATLLRW
jgi:3-oxoacyl-[acyl-carrier-protein] synthase-3